MTSALLLFACTFAAVFALGLQSLNVNGGHHVAATLTSILISAATIWLYKAMPGSDWIDIAAYMLGAIAGINTSMWIHPRVKTWAARRRTPDEHADVTMCGGYQPRRSGTGAPKPPPRAP